MTSLKKRLNTGKVLKNKEIIYVDIDNRSLEPVIYMVHMDDGDIIWSSIKMDNTQYEIYQRSKNKDELLILMVENNSQFSKNINNHPNLKTFLKDKNILDKVRNFKLNKIIN